MERHPLFRDEDDSSKPPNQRLGYCQTHADNLICPQCNQKKYWLYQPYKYTDYSVCSTCFHYVDVKIMETKHG